MATVTHYIRSNYDPEKDKDRLLKETDQISHLDDQEWHQESSLAGFHNSNPLTRPLNFVPAAASLFTSEPTPTSDHSHSGDVATWYRSLSRQSNSDPVDQRPTTSSHQPRLVAAPKQRPHWFISRAISQSASGPAPTLTSSNDSLADILSRKPPTTDRPFKPPVFLHLGPSNKGWTMLQNQGWSEGEALGPNSRRKSDEAHVRTGTNMRKNERKKKKKKEGDGGGGGSSSGISAGELDASPSQVRITEATHDDIVKLEGLHLHHHLPKTTTSVVPDTVIDLTLSDDSSSSSSEESQEWEDDPDVTMTPGSDSAARDSPPATIIHQTALLTPLPTVLKSDRLGIGLKAKTEGPYRSSVKRVTHNAAALAAHARAAEDVRRSQQRFGKGRRAFARIERLERESRQNIMSYLSEP